MGITLSSTDDPASVLCTVTDSTMGFGGEMRGDDWSRSTLTQWYLQSYGVAGIGRGLVL
jgi:hypothetical protein